MGTLLTYTISYLLLLGFGVLVLRWWVPRDYRLRGGLSPWAAFIQALLFFGYGGFPVIYLEADWPAVYVPRGIYILGAVLLFSGLAGLLTGMFRLGLAKSLGRGGPGLAVTGLYRWSRNPQAIACECYVLGFLVLWPSWYALGWALLYCFLIHWMILAEETHLFHRFGQEDEAYCKRVPRYFRSPHTAGFKSP